MKIKSRTTIGGTFLSNNFLKSIQNLHLLNAFVASSVQRIIGIPALRYQLDTSWTNQLHCVVLVPTLKPNCRESVHSRSPQISSTVLSKSFRIWLDPAIAR